MKKILLVSPLLLLFASCADLNETTKDSGEQFTQVVASSEPITEEGLLTRIVPMPKNGETGTGYTFPWQPNDKIAVYGSTSDASGWGFFTISEGVNASVGKFTGIFKMLPDVSYYAFYPANKFSADTDESAIPVDYTGQNQTENASTSHLAPFVYEAAKADESFYFAFKHLDGLVRFNVYVSLTTSFSKLVLTCDEPVFVNKGTIDLTTATTTVAPDITPIETSNTFEVALGNGAGIHAQNGMLTVYAMMAPAAVAGKEIVLSLEDTAGETVFSDNISFSANIAKGKAAYITCGTQNVHNGHEYVDLGITDANGSPVYWATCNIGATKPEDLGLYFAWGEVVGHTKNDGRVFDWASYRFMQDGYSDIAHITKYNYHGEETSLDIADDAAYRNWGGSWRMPTKEELEQLHTNCNWDETTINGVNGYKVSSKSDPSKYIFLPAAEQWSEYDYSEYFNGNYWSGTFDATEKLPYAMWWSTEIGWQGVSYHYQYYGLSLRAVCSFSTPAPAPFVNVSSINITGSTQKIYGDSSLKLTASVLPSDATNPTIEWYSSDPSVATVSNSGLVTGVNEGSVTITAKAADGSEVIAT